MAIKSLTPRMEQQLQIVSTLLAQLEAAERAGARSAYNQIKHTLALVCDAYQPRKRCHGQQGVMTMATQLKATYPIATEMFLKQRALRQGNTSLLTFGALKSLPALYSQEHVADPLCPVKFFDPCGATTWYATEARVVEENGRVIDVEFFGKVCGQEEELGYWTLRQLRSQQGYEATQLGPSSFRIRIPIERDIHWTPTRLSECH